MRRTVLLTRIAVWTALIVAAARVWSSVFGQENGRPLVAASLPH